MYNFLLWEFEVEFVLVVLWKFKSVKLGIKVVIKFVIVVDLFVLLLLESVVINLFKLKVWVKKLF